MRREEWRIGHTRRIATVVASARPVSSPLDAAVIASAPPAFRGPTRDLISRYRA
jgi:hypothetical protein